MISQQLENDAGIEARIMAQSVAARHRSRLCDLANSKQLWYGAINF